MSINKAVLKTTDGKEFTLTEQIPIPCFRCGICCTSYHIPVTPEDIEKIASALSMTIPEFLSKYARLAPIKEGYLLKRTDKGCLFLAWDDDGRARCTIYPFRPKACREWMPSLTKPECLEGLVKLKSTGQIMLPDELFPSTEDQQALYASLRKTLSSP